MEAMEATKSINWSGFWNVSRLFQNV